MSTIWMQFLIFVNTIVGFPVATLVNANRGAL